MARLAPEVAEIVREFRPGFRVGPATGSGHLYILDPAGSKVRTADGQPITLPLTPSDSKHGPKRRRAQLTKAGVLGMHEKVGKGHAGIDEIALRRAERKREEWLRANSAWRYVKRARRAPWCCRDCADEHGYQTDSEWRCPHHQKRHVKQEEHARLRRLGIDPDVYANR